MLHRQFATVEDYRRHRAEEETNLRAYRALAQGKGRACRAPHGGPWIAYDANGYVLGRVFTELAALRLIVTDGQTDAVRWSAYA